MSMPPAPSPRDSHAAVPRSRRWSAWAAGILVAALVAVALHRLTGRPRPASGQGLDEGQQPAVVASAVVPGGRGDRSQNTDERKSADRASDGSATTERASGDAPTEQEAASGKPPQDTTPRGAAPGGEGSLDVDSVSARQHRLILGRWTRNYYGKWLLKIEAGGVGSMTVEPDRLWALVIGPRVAIEMRWRIEDGKAVFDTISGEPPAAFEAAMKLWKKHQERKIVELTDERFVYLSDDGKSNSVWLRAPDEDGVEAKSPSGK